MDKTDTILLIYEKGGLQLSVAPSPPQPSNLSISQSGDVLINKFSMNLFDFDLHLQIYINFDLRNGYGTKT